jgi:hypothetical protein
MEPPLGVRIVLEEVPIQDGGGVNRRSSSNVKQWWVSSAR